MKKEIIIATGLVLYELIFNNKSRTVKEETNDILKEEVIKAFQDTIKTEEEIKLKIEEILLENSNISKELDKEELKTIVDKIRLKQKHDEVKKIKELLKKLNIKY